MVEYSYFGLSLHEVNVDIPVDLAEYSFAFVVPVV